MTSSEVQKFVGAAKVLYASEVALFVATCPFTPDALRAPGTTTAVPPAASAPDPPSPPAPTPPTPHTDTET
ncbi:hypothetical protein QQY66_24365 [Streptomyces sp. DG2A-72]|nr:hypothetical protein [Streptomyces sp. DG2A-72]MDO0934661.1 hypothetical protein [Streptomyces sp. DG2A-72]